MTKKIMFNDKFCLTQALDFLGITSVELTHNPERGGNEFVLNDDIRIILMPMLSPWDEYDAAVKLVD